MGNSACNCKFKEENRNEVQMAPQLPTLENNQVEISKTRDEPTSSKTNIKTCEETQSRIEASIKEIKKISFVKKIQNAFRNYILRKSFKKQNFSFRGDTTYPSKEDKKFTSNFTEGLIRYVGEMVGSNREGFGVQTWKDGAKFVGQWKDHKANGYGRFKHSDGDVYLGEFVNDKASGYGYYVHTNGAKYDGDWNEDFQEGIGFETWRDNSFYEGCYLRGKKHGIGKYSWADGSGYEGYWYENVLHGYGIYKFKDGRKYVGSWNMNAMDGYGEYSWEDGRKYFGFYKNDKKEGFGIYFWNPTRYFIGYWKDGKQDGFGKYTSNGTTRYGEWADGKRMKWFDDEMKAFEHVDKNNIPDCKKLFFLEINNFINDDDDRSTLK